MYNILLTLKNQSPKIMNETPFLSFFSAENFMYKVILETMINLEQFKTVDELNEAVKILENSKENLFLKGVSGLNGTWEIDLQKIN